jgi:hypothetical protein
MMSRNVSIHIDGERYLVPVHVQQHILWLRHQIELGFEGCARAILDDPRVVQIARSHASAQPSPRNPSWLFTHSDLDYVLRRLRHYAHGTEPGRGETVSHTVSHTIPLRVSSDDTDS